MDKSYFETDKKTLVTFGVLGFVLLVLGVFALVKIQDEDFTKTLGFFLFLFSAVLGVVVFFAGSILAGLKGKMDGVEHKLMLDELEKEHDQGL